MGRPRKHMSSETSQTPWTLTYVCRRWRKIALDLPAIWSHIDLLGYGEYYEEDTEALENTRRAVDPHLHFLYLKEMQLTRPRHPTHLYPLLLSTVIDRSGGSPLTILLGCPASLIDESKWQPMVEPTSNFTGVGLQVQFLRQLLVHHMRWKSAMLVGFTSCGEILTMGQRSLRAFVHNAPKAGYLHTRHGFRLA